VSSVEVGRELCVRRSARRDVPEDGEQVRKVVGVLEREDDATRRHGGAAKRGEKILGRTGRRSSAADGFYPVASYSRQLKLKRA